MTLNLPETSVSCEELTVIPLRG